MSWHNLNFLEKDQCIDLKITLTCGQAFRWKEINGEWVCGFENIIVRLKQQEDQIKFYSEKSEYKKIKLFLNDYFRCGSNLDIRLKSWSQDEQFVKLSKGFKGVRLLRQCPVENLFSFICSSNNNVARITGLVTKLAVEFGTKQWFVSSNGEEYNAPSFPTIDQLCKENMENTLRDLGFGYRAKYIQETAKMLNTKEKSYLLDLRNKSYEEAKNCLLELHGVGSKIADCVMLGSLDQLDAVPIDVHMFNVAKMHYGNYLDPTILNLKTVTNKAYADIHKMFINRWSPDAGWAQLIIFASELKHKKPQPKKSTKKRKLAD